MAEAQGGGGSNSDEILIRTSLFSKIRKGNLEKVKSILAKGVKTDIIDKNYKNNTPLHDAAEWNQKEIVEELLKPKWNTDINIENSEGLKPLQVATQKGYEIIQQLLASHQAKVCSESDGGNQVVAGTSGEEEPNGMVAQKQNLTYKRRSGACNTDGQYYEIYLSMWFLLKGVTDEKIIHFYLASNMEAAENFDDVILKFENENGQSKIIFLQAKQKKNPARLKIGKDDDFFLVECFNSYQKIKVRFSNPEASNPIFRGSFEDTEFLFFTNNLISDEFLDLQNILINDILNLGVEKKNYYQIKCEEKIVNHLKNQSDKYLAKDEIEDFLKKFKIYGGQPGVGGLREIVKNEVMKAFNVDEKDKEAVFLKVSEKMKEWWEKGNKYLTEDCKIFEEATRISVEFDIRAPVEKFTGRTVELEELHRLLQNVQKGFTRQIASVTGLGGMGKSELVRKYLQAYKKVYDGNIIWINTTNYETIQTSFFKLAKEKLEIPTKDADKKAREIKTIVQDVNNFFAKKQKKTLYVFDNAENLINAGNETEGIHTLLPFMCSSDFKPYIIITSRTNNWEEIATLKLNELTEKETKDFLKHALGQNVVEHELKKLSDKLQGFPLALKHAVAYINVKNVGVEQKSNEKFTIENYLSKLDENSQELLHHHGRTSICELYTGILQITVKEIKTKRRLAYDILRIMAYLAPDEIEIDFIFSKLANTDENIQDAVALLHQFSLVHNRADKAIIHRLVQTVIRTELGNQNKNYRIMKKAIELFREENFWQSPYSYRPHLSVLYKHFYDFAVKNSLKKEEIEKKYLKELHDLSCWFETKEAVLLKIQSMKIKREYGPNHLEYAKQLSKIILHYYSLRDNTNAFKMAKEAFPIYIKENGPESLEYAKQLEELSLRCSDNEEELLRMSLLIREKECGPESDDGKILVVTETGREGVREKERVFVKYFVSFYEKSLTEYCKRLEKHISKPGKWADFVNQLTEIGKSGTEGIETAGIKAPVVVGINTLQIAIASIRNKPNRDEFKKIIGHLYKFKNHRDQVRNALVQSGIEIFHSFESQFVQLTANGCWERAMQKLAHDAVNRILSFSRTNFDEEVLTAPFFTKGVIYGESKKKYKYSSTGVPRIIPGHTVQTANSKSWNTAELFENVGLVTILHDGTPHKYYQKKGNKISYGYRRIFKWESEDLVKSLKKYQETHADEEYQYVLQLDDIKNLNKKLPAEINTEDSKLMEGRLDRKYIIEMKLNSIDNYKKIEKLLNDFEQSNEKKHKALLKSQQGLQQEVNNLKDEIKKMKVVEPIPERREKNEPSILFDARETVTLVTGRDEEGSNEVYAFLP